MSDTTDTLYFHRTIAQYHKKLFNPTPSPPPRPPSPTRVFLEKVGPKTFIYWNLRKFLSSYNRKEIARIVKMGRAGTDRAKNLTTPVVFLLMLCFRSKAYLLYLIIKSILRRTGVQLRGCWHDTGATFAAGRFHSGSLPSQRLLKSNP